MQQHENHSPATKFLKRQQRKIQNRVNKANPDPTRAAYNVLCTAMENHEAAILTTASADGIPHATWMATMTSLDFRRLITLTSPDSRKVANIRSNPRVEWLFTDASQTQVVYVQGTATVVEDVVDIKKAWNLIPHKEQAFFLRSFNSKPGFAVIETRIEAVTYCVPAKNQMHRIDPTLLAAQTVEAQRTSTQSSTNL